MNDMIIVIITLKLIKLATIKIPTTSSAFDLVISFSGDDNVSNTDSETTFAVIISASTDISFFFSSIVSIGNEIFSKCWYCSSHSLASFSRKHALLCTTDVVVLRSCVFGLISRRCADSIALFSAVEEVII